MDNGKYTDLLQKKGVKPTAIRLLVMKAIDSAPQAVSLSDIETVLDTVDKSSIFRSLEVFVKHHIVHAINDGSGSMKYELCENGTECTMSDMHTHFFCTACKKTFCLKSVKIPPVEIPSGFKAISANYIVQGVCKECSEKHGL